MASQEENTKLTDVEKFKLIDFCRENPDLWVTNQGVSRTKKLLKKEELVKEFDGKFSIEILEKVFHGLRASYLREHKKYKDGNLPTKTWKLYESMLFLSENGPMQKVVFTTEEREREIYEANPALWNHGMVEYRNRNLHCALLQKLVLEFDEKFSEEEIKKAWNTLSTYYK